MPKSLRYLIPVLVLGMGVAICFFFSPKARVYQVHLRSSGALQSSQLPPTQVEMELRGQVQITPTSSQVYLLQGNLQVQVSLNGAENRELASQLQELMRAPITVTVNSRGESISIAYLHSLEAMNPEVALNLWRTLAKGIFLPTDSGKITGEDLWGPAEFSVNCSAGKCTLKGDSLSVQSHARFSGSTRSEWEQKGGVLIRARTQMENQIQNIMFQSSSTNRVEVEPTSRFDGELLSVPTTLTSYPAFMETDGQRNKLRSLRAQFKDMPFEDHLQRLKEMPGKAKPVEVFHAAETLLLLFPERSGSSITLLFDLALPPLVKSVFVTALVKASRSEVQAVLREWIVKPEFKPYVSSALLVMTFHSQSARAWADTLRALGKLYPEQRATAEFTLCSLAGALRDPSLVADRLNRADPNAESLLCLGNAGLSDAIPILETAWKKPELRETVLFSLRFIRDPKVMEFYREAAKDSGLLAALFRSVDLRIQRGIFDPGLKEFLAAIPVKKFSGRGDLRDAKEKLLEKF